MSILQIQMKTLCRLCIVTVVLFVVPGCAAKYTIKTEPISGTVVDADTGEPVEDVIVIGYWPGYTYYFERNLVAPIEILEVITDKEGKYFTPGWLKNNLESSFNYGDPEMIFYKTGYEMAFESNAFTMENFKKMPGYFHPWRAEWDGKIIKMKRFKGDNRAYREYLYKVQHRRPFKRIFEYCMYMNVPRLLIAMEKYYQTQPDYWMPGRTVQVSDTSVRGIYRSAEFQQKDSSSRLHSNTENPQLDKKPLPSILTITKMENYSSRCEVSPIEYLKRITSNEKDFIRSSNVIYPASQ